MAHGCWNCDGLSIGLGLLPAFDCVDSVAEVAAKPHDRDCSLPRQPIDMAFRHLPAISKLLRGEQLISGERLIPTIGVRFALLPLGWVHTHCSSSAPISEPPALPRIGGVHLFPPLPRRLRLQWGRLTSSCSRSVPAGQSGSCAMRIAPSPATSTAPHSGQTPSSDARLRRASAEATAGSGATFGSGRTHSTSSFGSYASSPRGTVPMMRRSVTCAFPLYTRRGLLAIWQSGERHRTDGPA